MNTEKLTSTQTETAFKNILDERFIKTDEVASILSLAFTSNKNAIIFGPAGHGKSDMLKYITNALIPKRCPNINGGSCNGACECPEEDKISDVFVQSFGEGMDEAQLWGGVDMGKLQDPENPRLEYAPQYSFLNYSFAIFEEIFDAPATVLLSLKDTLTARELRNGYQRYPMKTRCVVALTNKRPEEISKLGPSAHALIERFPLQLNLQWDSYEYADFKELFDKVYPSNEHRGISDIKKTLAELLASAHAKSQFVSPRSAIHALECVLQHKDRGDSAYNILRHVPGFEGLIENMERDLHDARYRRQCVDAIVTQEMEFDDYYNMTIEANDPIQCLRSIKKFKEIDSTLEVMSMPDDLYAQRNDLRDRVKTAIDVMANMASELAENMEF